MYEELLNLPEETGRLGTMVAISDLIHEAERLEAARAAKEAELLELRAQTAELFGSVLEAAGNDEGTVSAAKAMWERDPQTAAQAIAGCSIEEAVSAARGCNQHKHKPGCDAENNSSDTESSSKTKEIPINRAFKRQMHLDRESYSDRSYGIAGDKAYVDYEDTIKHSWGNWKTGTFTAGGKKYEVNLKIYPREHKDEPSQFGIEGGDISKCWMRDENGKEVVNYDRGWDKRPKSEEVKMALRTILDKYNGTRVDDER